MAKKIERPVPVGELKRYRETLAKFPEGSGVTHHWCGGSTDGIVCKVSADGKRIKIEPATGESYWVVASMCVPNAEVR